MAKYLQEILGEDYLQDLLEVHSPFPDDEKRFYEKHGLELGKEGEPPVKFPRFPNMYSEPGKHNADQLFNGATKVYDREKDNYGYSNGKDTEHYEEYIEESFSPKPGKVHHYEFPDGSRHHFIFSGDRQKNGNHVAVTWDSGASGRSKRKPKRTSVDSRVMERIKETPENEIPPFIKQHKLTETNVYDDRIARNNNELAKRRGPGALLDLWSKAKAVKKAKGLGFKPDRSKEWKSKERDDE